MKNWCRVDQTEFITQPSTGRDRTIIIEWPLRWFRSFLKIALEHGSLAALAHLFGETSFAEE